MNCICVCYKMVVFSKVSILASQNLNSFTVSSLQTLLYGRYKNSVKKSGNKSITF